MTILFLVIALLLAMLAPVLGFFAYRRKKRIYLEKVMRECDKCHELADFYSRDLNCRPCPNFRILGGKTK